MKDIKSLGRQLIQIVKVLSNVNVKFSKKKKNYLIKEMEKVQEAIKEMSKTDHISIIYHNNDDYYC